MSLPFPSLDFFRALQQRTKDEAAAFEKLGVCDTTFGIRVGDQLYRIAFGIYECTEIDECSAPAGLDFVLSAPRGRTGTPRPRSRFRGAGRTSLRRRR